MKAAYPIVMTKGKDRILVFIPDFGINTQGESYADAMTMARDAIGAMGIDMEDDHEQVPTPTEPEAVERNGGDIITLVDVDFDEYRRKNSTRTVRRNVSLPEWLDTMAREAEINVSAVLTRALKRELHVADR